MYVAQGHGGTIQQNAQVGQRPSQGQVTQTQSPGHRTALMAGKAGKPSLQRYRKVSRNRCQARHTQQPSFEEEGESTRYFAPLHLHEGQID